MFDLITQKTLLKKTIKITVYRKQLNFLWFLPSTLFDKFLQILSAINPHIFEIFLLFFLFQKDCLEVMQKFYLHIDLNWKINFLGYQILSAKLQISLSTNVDKAFSFCFFSFQSLNRKIYFAVLTVAKTGLGLEILGNFKAKLNNIVK